MTRRNFGAGFWLVLVAAGSLVLALGAADARAVVVGAAPAWPVPVGVPAGPPPVPALPVASGVPPAADQIADPVTPAAVCGGWYLQHNYGDRWPASSTWWEYRCSFEDARYHNTCPGPACNAFCPDCYWETQDWSDYFYWDGSSAVFSGEAYSDSVVYDSGDSYASVDWWDAPTAQWYDIAPRFPLTVSKAGTGSGQVSSSSPGISCGDSCQASFDAGTVVSLAAAADASSTFTGWSGDCSGTGACQVTIDQARSVTATFALKPPPHASFTVGCTGLSCSFDGSSSSDPNGTIQTYRWDFGDGTSAPGATASHTYAQPGSYGVSLTVTDNAGASGSTTRTVSPITLTARGYKVQAIEKVDLSWNGPSGTSFDVYRNGAKRVTVTTTAYTDTIGTRPGSYRYQVCAPTLASCSNAVTVSFQDSQQS